MRRIIYILANVILSAIIFASCSGVDEENTVNGFEYVDLGLPSGTKWAASNIGAKAPESAGSYFAWGEISESNYYTEAECETCNLSVADLTKHEIIKSLRLTANYDAATYNMGIGWQTPTKQQYEELKTNSRGCGKTSHQDIRLSLKTVNPYSCQPQDICQTEEI